MHRLYTIAMWFWAVLGVLLIVASPVLLTVGLWQHDLWVAASGLGLFLTGCFFGVLSYAVALVTMDIR